MRSSLGEVGVQPSEPTLRTQHGVERCVRTDAETVEYAAVSVRLDSKRGRITGVYACLLHQYVAVWTVTVDHRYS